MNIQKESQIYILFFFIKNDSFVVVSTLDTDVYINLPFETVTYHDSEIIGSYGDKYCFCIRLTFDNGFETEKISFSTPNYHHKIDRLIYKKYPGLLNDEKLYDFICENFPDEKEYRRRRDLERKKAYDDFFETSIFHKFTNIDAE